MGYAAAVEVLWSQFERDFTLARFAARELHPEVLIEGRHFHGVRSV